jgi:gliding motility-associated-like protein
MYFQTARENNNNLLLTISPYIFLLTFCLLIIHEAQGFSSPSIENYLYTHASPAKQASSDQPKEKTALHDVFKDHVKSKSVKFVENKGQMVDMKSRPVPFVLFKAEAPEMSVYITEKGLTYVFVKHIKKKGYQQEINSATSFREQLKTEMAWVHVNLAGATIKRENIIKETESSEHFNYFYAHCQQGVMEVHQYDKITLKDVYPGIDWVFYNSQTGGMKYDFVVHPGADPSQIQLIYEGKNPLTLLEDGGLSMQTPLGNLKEDKPYTYEQDGNREVNSNYRLTTISNNQTLLKFNLARYDSSKRLIIDPQLYWYTFYGGNSVEDCFSTDTDEEGNIFVTGGTSSENFPLLDPGDPVYFSSDYSTLPFAVDLNVFLLKFSASGNLLWATYYGGFGEESAYSIETDLNGDVFVTGWTKSQDFPVQSAGGGSYNQPTYGGGFMDAFILQFQNNGTRLWASYYGGSGQDQGYGLSTDLQGNLWLTGKTDSPDFPTQNTGTFFQGTHAGESDAFILKFDNLGVRQWATYYGGSGSDEGHSISTDTNGNAFVTGETFSDNFSTQNNGGYFQSNYGGAGDAFVLKFSSDGSNLWATYYGGLGYDTGISICNDSQGNLFVLGSSESTDFPLQNSGTFFQGTFNGGFSDAFFLKFDNNGARLWATLMGGDESENFGTFDNLGVDKCDHVYFAFIHFTSPMTEAEASIPNNSFPYIINTINAPFFIENATCSSEPILGRLSNNGDLQWCSYMGGSGAERRTCIDIDQSNSVVFCSHTGSDIYCPFLPSTYPLTDPGSGAYFDNTLPTGGDFAELIISKLPIPQLQTNSNTILPNTCTSCDGSITINVTSGNGTYTYDWSNGVIQSNVSATSSSINNLCSGNYTVVVSNVNYCNLSDTVSISLGSQEGGTLDLGDDAIVCDGETIVLSALGFESVIWQDGSTDESFTVEESGTYSVNVTDAFGCNYNDAVTITVNYAPNAAFSANPQPTTIDDTEITFTSTSTTAPLIYTWSFEDGTPEASAEENPVVNFPPIPGYYTISLVVENANGCVDSLSSFILIESDGTITLPNIFTPNGDGDNDRFVPFEAFPGNWILTIFNRWGVEVFATENLSQGWNGDDSPSATYYWVLQPRDEQQGENRAGYVMLVRD